MIWLVGGTSDARKLIESLESTEQMIITVATDAGSQLLKDVQVEVGRLDTDQMIDFIKKHRIEWIIDMAHPFAQELHKNVKQAADHCNIPLTRYLRGESDIEGNLEQSFEDLVQSLSRLEQATVLFTTGSKNVFDFEKVKAKNRFIYRVLPASESIQVLEKANVSIRDRIAQVGPFTVEQNRLTMTEYKVTHMVLKNSGKKSGTKEKMEACKALNIIPLILERKEECGEQEMDNIRQAIERMQKTRPGRKEE